MRLCKDDKSVLKREIFACEANRILPTRQGHKRVDTCGVLSPKIGVNLLSLHLSLFYNNYVEKSQMIF